MEQNTDLYYHIDKSDGGEPCKRTRRPVKDDNIYFLYGKDWIRATCPYENRVESQKLRQIINEICEAATDPNAAMDAVMLKAWEML